jgi:hypothetical protein
MRQSRLIPVRAAHALPSLRASFPLRKAGRGSIPVAPRGRRSPYLAPVPGSGERDRSRPADGRSIVGPVSRILITASLALAALASAAVVAFGTNPDWARHARGLDWIMSVRRLQWPLVLLCLVSCLALIELVVAGRRRAAWLIVLAPILFLFYHRFAGDEFRRMAILENPPFVAADRAPATLKPESNVIGLVVEGQPYAYPCAALYLAPVIVHAEADKRVIVMYSPYAGRARAWYVDHTIKPREFDVVSMPANATLLYNARIGQFVNAFTGATPAGERPDGFLAPADLRKVTWREWRASHPDTKVLATAMAGPSAERGLPRFPMRPAELQLPPETRVALLGTARPAVLQPSKLSGTPLNVTAGGSNLLIVPDKAGMRVFDRAVKGDLFPRFARKAVPKKPEIAFVDSDTGSFWTADGVCVEGYAKGERLRAVSVEEDLPYGTLKSFYPQAELVRP